jgi:hypothetical protein
MIKLKTLLQEMTDTDLQRCLEKIRNKQYEFIAGGDNGKVYQLVGEDKVFKITNSQDEYEIADIIVDKWTTFTTFIPVYYVNGRNMFIMANANPLPQNIQKDIDLFMQDFALFSRDEGGEVSIFDFMEVSDSVNPQLTNFLTALQSDIAKLNVPEFELDLDFRAENIMIWNNNLVMVDW